MTDISPTPKAPELVGKAAIVVIFPEPAEPAKFGYIAEKVKRQVSDIPGVRICAARGKGAEEVNDLFTPKEPSNLVMHAKRELFLIGEDKDTVQGYLNVIQAFADMNHSGGSASVAIPTLNALLQFKNLRPLTDNPDEWEDRTEMSGYPLWQNRRNPEAMSKDEGKTYWYVSEVDHNGIYKELYTSEKYDAS